MKICLFLILYTILRSDFNYLLEKWYFGIKEDTWVHLPKRGRMV